MRIIKPGSRKRPRIQFYLTEELDEMMQKNRAVAKKLGLRLDFQEAFRAWFLKENEEARRQLDGIRATRGNNGETHTS
ncbi:hypothetical protein [Geomonas oryzae]|uniref:hypothetical protein n=1 Tax=Geomonas oryzae TaxID=2364273 RepID=UPI00100B7E7F|nr:hypothetical protein [Geomonas oryzae]